MQSFTGSTSLGRLSLNRDIRIGVWVTFLFFMYLIPWFLGLLYAVLRKEGNEAWASTWAEGPEQFSNHSERGHGMFVAFKQTNRSCMFNPCILPDSKSTRYAVAGRVVNASRDRNLFVRALETHTLGRPFSVSNTFNDTSM